MPKSNSKTATSRVIQGSHGLPHGLLEKRTNVYAGPHGFTGFYPQGGYAHLFGDGVPSPLPGPFCKLLVAP